MKPFAFAQKEAGNPASSVIQSVSELPNAEILIIEDETLMSALIQRYLKTLNPQDLNGRRRSEGPVKVLSLESGWELLNADLAHIRVAVVDVLLPQVTGVDLIRDFVRRYPQMGLVPVTGMATEPMKRSLKELLAEPFEVLNKPLRREEFLEAFQKAWKFSHSAGIISPRPLRKPGLPIGDSLSDADNGPNAIEDSFWSAGVSNSHPTVAVLKRKKPPKKAA